MKAIEHLQAVVLAGGSGTRFWPLLDRIGPSNFKFEAGVLLWQTFDRLSPLIQSECHWMVVGQAHAEGCRTASEFQTTRFGEPCSRNTAAAIGLAAPPLHDDADAVMAILPADHHVRDGRHFVAQLK